MSRRALSIVVGIALLAVGVVAGWWAGQATMSEEKVDDESVRTVEVAAVEGRVGRSLSVGVTVEQPVVPVATNTLSGMITYVAPAGELNVGDTVYTVAGMPVRVIEGDTPFYRPLAQRSTGDDVRQLQAALVELGYLNSEPDGNFGAATRNAVRAWQADLGIERTGTIQLGEVLAVPQLPTRIRAGEDIQLGTMVSGGETGVLASGGEREFTLVLSTDQAAAITTEVPLIIYFDDYVWDAVIAGSSQNETGHTVYELTAPDGNIVCGTNCDELPPNERLSLRAEAVVVPDVSGPTLPTSAIRTALDGSSYVLLPNGEQRPVTVLGSGQGVAVVEGVNVGESVIVIGDEPSSTDTQPTDPDVPDEPEEPDTPEDPDETGEQD